MASRLIFPTELRNEDQFLMMRVYEYSRPKRSAAPQKPLLLEIQLPIPSNLVDATSVTYQQQSLGYIGEAAGGAAGDIMADLVRGNETARGSVVRIADKIKGMSITGEAGKIASYYGSAIAQERGGAIIGAALGGTIGALAGAAAGEVIRGAMYASGITRNPFNVQMFENVNFRSFNFQYKFVPRSLEEQDTINNIVKLLKFHMLPGYLDFDRTFFTYPDLFELELNIGTPVKGDDINNYLFKIKTSVLESINVNYHGEGFADYHDSGEQKAPVSITMDLNFKEMIIPERDDIDKSASNRVIAARSASNLKGYNG